MGHLGLQLPLWGRWDGCKGELSPSPKLNTPLLLPSLLSTNLEI